MIHDPSFPTEEPEGPTRILAAAGESLTGDPPSTVVLSSSEQGEFRDVERNAPAIPLEIAHFRLLQPLGAGGFGVVWKALDQTLDRHVAIKFPRRAMATAEELDRFLHEARIVARLRHPNIVRVHEVGMHTAEPNHSLAYIVSDFVDGISLSAWGEAKPRTYVEIARLCALVAQTLQHAHDDGIIHLDLKPGNIMIDRGGQHCVMDFGLARRVSEDWRDEVEGTVMGTPAYMAPEQAAGEAREIGAASDVYALGVILYELLTGRLPFTGTFREVLRAVVEDDPIPPRRIKRQIPADLEAICLKCLRKSPEERFASPRELGEELARFVYDEPIRSRTLPIRERMSRWIRRNPRLAGAAVGSTALLMLLLLAGWWAFLDERQDRLRLEEAITQGAYARQLFLQTEDFRELRRQVEGAASDPELAKRLREFAAAPELRATLRILHAQTQSAPADDAIRRNFVRHPARAPLQAWLDTRMTSGSGSIFSWMLLDREGVLVARAPVADAIGRDYAWRAYFHGGPRDWHSSEAIPVQPGGGQAHLRATNLSAILLTEVTDRHVAVISTPIQDQGEFLGVLGIMIDLASQAP